MAITTEITAPIWPQTADGKTVFNQKSDALAPQLINIQEDMNTYATEANALRDEVNGFQQTASAAAVAAANAQTAAEGFRDEAEGFKDDSQAILDSNTAIAAAVQSAAGLPSLTGNAGFYLQVNVTEDGVEWTEIEVPAGGTNSLLTYVNNTASGTVDLDFSLYSAFEITAVGDLTLNAINLPTNGTRSTALLSAINFDLHTITLGDNISQNVTFPQNEYSSLKNDSSGSIAYLTETPAGMVSSSDGGTVFVSYSNGVIRKYTKTGDASTLIYSGEMIDISSTSASIRGITLNDNEDSLFVVTYSNQSITEIVLNGVLDMSSYTIGSTLSYSSESTNVQDLSFSDGFNLYLVTVDTDEILQYGLSIEYDLSSGVLSDSYEMSLESGDEAVTGIYVSNNGSRVTVVDNNSKNAEALIMTTPNDISTATKYGHGELLSIASMGGIHITEQDGCFYIVDKTSDLVYQHDILFNNDIVSSISINSMEITQVSNSVLIR